MEKKESSKKRGYIAPDAKLWNGNQESIERFFGRKKEK